LVEGKRGGREKIEVVGTLKSHLFSKQKKKRGVKRKSYYLDVIAVHRGNQSDLLLVRRWGKEKEKRERGEYLPRD